MFGSRRLLVAVLVAGGLDVVVARLVHGLAEDLLLELVDRPLGMGFGIGPVALLVCAGRFLIAHVPPCGVVSIIGIAELDGNRKCWDDQERWSCETGGGGGDSPG